MKKQLQNAMALMLFVPIGVGLMQGFCRAEVAATPQTKPTIFVVGDSTARNNAKGARGWADPFSDYFDPAKATVRNSAMAGRSTRTYTAEGRWDNVAKELKTGDFVLIQMGHNDGGPVGSGKDRASLPGLGEETQEVVKPDGSKEIVHTYGWYLRKFVSEAKAKGATPILMSLTVRNLWRGDKVRRDNGGYAQWTQETAQAQNVPFVDVTKIIADRYDAMGQEAVKAMFGPDYVHTSPAGADLNAASVVAGLKAIPNSRFLGLLSQKGAAVKPEGTLVAAATVAGGVAALATPHQKPKKPTLWLIGDSTMKVGTRGQMGWGDAVGAYFDLQKITVNNRGRSAQQP